MIILDENYRVESDSLSHTLIQEEVTNDINPKTGKPTTINNRWYYPKLGGCLKKYLGETLKKCDTIQSVLNRIDEVEKIIINIP